MNGAEAIEWIHNQLKFGIRPGLERVTTMLEQVGNPEKKLKLIHVGGTNGKGSTVTYLRNLLNAHDFKVGTFTSPYIERFEERISINGLPIDGDDLATYVEEVKPICDDIGQTSLGSPTEFEIITVISLMHFHREQVDYGIVEVGLGGRLDSTNVIEPMLSLITSIGMDHMDILGDSIEKIAYEKAGIIKQGIPVATNVHQRSAVEIIREKALQQHSPYYQLGNHYHYQMVDSERWGESFEVKAGENKFSDLQLQMRGKHQVENATLALFALTIISEKEGFQLDRDEISNGLLRSTWPGRFEIIHEHPLIIVDGAHNVEALNELIQTTNKEWQPQQVTVLMSVLKGKPMNEMINLMNKNFQNVIITPFDFPGSYEYNELYVKFQKNGLKIRKNWKSAVEQFIDEKRKNQILLVTGSLYYISQVRSYVLQNM